MIRLAGVIHVVEASGAIVRYKVMSNLKIHCCAGWQKGIINPRPTYPIVMASYVIRGKGRGTHMALCAYASVVASELDIPL